MSKMNICIWGRKFELDVIYKTFDNANATDTQVAAIEEFGKKDQIDDSLEHVKEYVIKNDGKENGITAIDNIFRFVMPRCIYVPQEKNRTVAILCDYKFDPEHGIAVVYENGEYIAVEEEGVVI